MEYAKRTQLVVDMSAYVAMDGLEPIVENQWTTVLTEMDSLHAEMEEPVLMVIETIPAIVQLVMKGKAVN